MFIDQNTYPPILIRTHGIQSSKYGMLLRRPWTGMRRFPTESDNVEIPIFGITIFRDERALFKELVTICDLSINIGNTIHELSTELKDGVNSFIKKIEELTSKYDIVYITYPTSILDAFLEKIISIIKEAAKINHLPQLPRQEHAGNSAGTYTKHEPGKES